MYGGGLGSDVATIPGALEVSLVGFPLGKTARAYCDEVARSADSPERRRRIQQMLTPAGGRADDHDHLDRAPAITTGSPAACGPLANWATPDTEQHAIYLLRPSLTSCYSIFCEAKYGYCVMYLTRTEEAKDLSINRQNKDYRSAGPGCPRQLQVPKLYTALHASVWQQVVAVAVAVAADAIVGLIFV